MSDVLQCTCSGYELYYQQRKEIIARRNEMEPGELHKELSKIKMPWVNGLRDEDGYELCPWCGRIRFKESLAQCPECHKYFKGYRKYPPIDYECEQCG